MVEGAREFSVPEHDQIDLEAEQKFSDQAEDFVREMRETTRDTRIVDKALSLGLTPEDLLRLSEQFDTNDVTGLPRRKLMDRELPRELARSDRTERPVVLAYIDIDDFKDLNTRLGYERTNMLLAEIAKILQREIRGTDLLYHWGGDEFVLALENVDAAQAEKILTDLQTEVSRTMAEIYPERALNISYGLAVYQPNSGASYQQALSEANTRLLEAKKRKSSIPHIAG